MLNYQYILKLALLAIILCSPFNLFPQGTYNAYFGNLHSHTSNSDGVGEPEDAYNYARNTAGSDFLAVTDHMEQIEFWEWYSVKNDADDLTENGSFVAIAAWEWGSPLYGHINIFDTDEIISDAINLWYYSDLETFLEWVSNNHPAVGQFNHPGDEETFNNWNDFEYISSGTDDDFALIEFQNIQQATDWYEFALSKGWHLSPVWNQDNHSADWGTKNDGRAGLWASSLTRSALFEAINAGRTFATMDKNAKIWIDLNDVAMGSQVPIQTSMTFHLNLFDEDNETFSSIELVTKNGIIMNLGEQTGNYETNITLNLTDDQWIFVRAIQADGDYLWSAPVYITGTLSGVLTNDSENQIQIYPNPANETITINAGTEDAYVLIYDVAGNVIYENTINQSFTFCSKSFISGIYFVNVITPRQNMMKKIIVVK